MINLKQLDQQIITKISSNLLVYDSYTCYIQLVSSISEIQIFLRWRVCMEAIRNMLLIKFIELHYILITWPQK